MEGGRGGTSLFLANHGYFVSTLSDDEDDHYWREGGREGIQERKINTWTDFEHELQLKKSKACSEASKYSLQRSLELLMARSIYKGDPEELSKSPSVQPLTVKVRDMRLQQYVMEPTQEVVVTSGVTANTANLDDPIHMELYYNEPQRASLHEVHNKQTCKYFTTNPVSSKVMIYDWEDETRQESTDAYNSHYAMIRPQRECKDLAMGPTAYPFRKTANSQSDDDITTPKKLSRQSRSQERGPYGCRRNPASVNSPMLMRVDSVKNRGAISVRGCLSRVTEHEHDFLQKFHNSNDDQITCQKKESRMQDNVPVSPTMRCKHMRSSHHRQGHSKHQHQEARHDKGYREDIWTLANTEVSNHASLRTPCLAKQGIRWDQRNTFWASKPPVERQHSNRKDVELSLVNTSNTPDYITVPERENSVTELRNSKVVKHEVPSTQSVKEQLLSAINLAGRVRQNSTQSNDSNSIAKELGEEDKSLDAESPHSKCLRERQLQTLSIIDYKISKKDRKTINIPLSSNVIASENSRTNVHTFKRKDGAISNYLRGKENANQTENIYVPSELEETRSVENRKLPASSSVTEDQSLQVSIYSPSQQVEEANVEVQGQSKESELVVESNSRDQVDAKAPEPYTELALQSNTVLKLLRDLQVQRPKPDKCYENTSIFSTKPEGMADAAPQCGYLAQYLKMQNIGARGTRRLLTTRR